MRMESRSAICWPSWSIASLAIVSLRRAGRCPGAQPAAGAAEGEATAAAAPGGTLTVGLGSEPETLDPGTPSMSRSSLCCSTSSTRCCRWRRMRRSILAWRVPGRSTTTTPSSPSTCARMSPSMTGRLSPPPRSRRHSTTSSATPCWSRAARRCWSITSTRRPRWWTTTRPS